MNYFRKGHPIGYVVLLAMFACILYVFSNRREEWFIFGSEGMALVYDIAVSTIAAGIFYYFQVYIPEKKKKQTIKENFKKYWEQTKERIITILLGMSGSYRADLPEYLCDFHNFRTYFNEKHDTEEGQTRWHGVLNSLSDESIDDIIIEFEGLVREIDFLLNKIEVSNNEIFQFLKRLQSALYHHKKVRLEFGEEKELSRFLWDILGSWSVVDGPRNTDLIGSMIDEI